MCFKGIVFHHVFNDIMLFLEEVELCIDFMFFPLLYWITISECLLY